MMGLELGVIAEMIDLQGNGMTQQRESPEQRSPEDLDAIVETVQIAAQSRQNDSQALLALLRLLEALHRDIRENLFQNSLPDNRQALYALLRDIETDGGWPYIHRMKLQAFLANLTDLPARGEVSSEAALEEEKTLEGDRPVSDSSSPL